jgi:hypothetical protein
MDLSKELFKKQYQITKLEIQLQELLAKKNASVQKIAELKRKISEIRG